MISGEVAKEIERKERRTEVVSRLIHDDNVRLCESQSSKGDTRLLSSRRIFHGLEGIVSSDLVSS